ncbi:cation diffusion facilitator family transporter [Scatolibacter rhodanostii]|uniref:cation diffusion facilitator family transporter n=1 Tax=Scatolibacter rhodanostii TaxID=2014781 RepID=UPI000C0885D9|nr:cation diffusion facilitator family transporter [Scatolibacter rhodanostii]
MDFLMKLWVKEYPQEVENSLVRLKCGKVAGAIGVLSNILLFAIKLLAGLLAGSVAMIADAVNNLTDCASSLITAVGFKLSEKPADDKHPFGHARIEYLAGMIVSFLIIFVGFQLGVSSFTKIFEPQEVTFPPLVAVILVVSILLKIWQSLFFAAVGKTLDSSTLLATSKDSRNDVISTTVILLGAIFTHFTGITLDGYLGLVVAIFILISGGKLILETADPLLGTAPNKELTESIVAKILSYDGILGVHDLTVHNYGAGRRFASVHCEVSAEEDILKSHDIIDNVERDIAHEMNIQLVIHLDPIVTNNEQTNALKKQVIAEVTRIYPKANIHDFRVVWGITHTNVLFDVALPFAEKDSDITIHKKITDLVGSIDETYRSVIVIDRVSENAI